MLKKDPGVTPTTVARKGKMWHPGQVYICLILSETPTTVMSVGAKGKGSA